MFAMPCTMVPLASFHHLEWPRTPAAEANQCRIAATNRARVPDHPTDTVAAPIAYSSTRSQPIIHASQFAHRGVSVRISASGHGNHSGEFAVADAGESAADSGHDKRQHNTGAGMVGRRFSGDDEDARANDGADAEGDQRDRTQTAPERMLRFFRFRQNPLERLGCKKVQISTSSCAITPYTLLGGVVRKRAE